MAPDDPTEPPAPGGDDPAAAEPQGVFGNLPHTRPGARSPRRDQAAGARRTAAPAEARAAASAEPPRAGPEPDPPPPGRPAPGPEGTAQGGGLEDVAWAGVAAAAEAATIGVRLATRALEAMRDAVDRR